MRDYINSGLIMGTLVALPVGALMGGALGALAALVRRRLTRGIPDPTPTISPA